MICFNRIYFLSFFSHSLRPLPIGRWYGMKILQTHASIEKNQLSVSPILFLFQKLTLIAIIHCAILPAINFFFRWPKLIRFNSFSDFELKMEKIGTNTSACVRACVYDACSVM